MTARAPDLRPDAGAKPRWEFGYRVHGYWLGNQRVGHVGLSPRGFRPVLYTWALDISPRTSGERSTLNRAKRAVEAAWSLTRPKTPVLGPPPKPWWKDPPVLRVGENCIRCRRWNPRFVRACSQCDVAMSWALVDNIARSCGMRRPASGRDPGPDVADRP